MKKILFLLAFMSFLGVYAQPQLKMNTIKTTQATSSAKIVTQKMPTETIKNEWTAPVTDGIFTARCKASQTHVFLEITSKEEGMADFTAKICGESRQDVNGWQRIKFYKNKPVVVVFAKKDTCNDGWWWWFRNYKKSVLID